MLKDGLVARISIRTSILALRAIAPFSIVYCVCRASGWKWTGNRILVGLADGYAASEAVFYLFVYLPRRWWLNRPAPAATRVSLSSPERRKELFLRSWDATADPRAYLSGWFKGALIESLRGEDVKDFISWRLWNKMQRSQVDEVELAEYLAIVEGILQWKFPPGRSGMTSTAVTFEPLRMTHRPLIWYLLFVGGADLQFTALMPLYGYVHCTPSVRHALLTLPPRPLTLLRSRRSPSARLAYWYTSHTSKEHLPVLFIHGIGVGLHFYLSFFAEFMDSLQKRGIGLIAIELLTISSRVTAPLLSGEDMVEEIGQILKWHGWERVVLASHSYGSVVATWLLRDPNMTSMIGPLVFVDPVAFSFHAPSVPWNFLRRRPRTASEWQLWYFASTDPDVAVTLTRRFDWVANSLWREEVINRRRGDWERGDESWGCTVILGGRDIITDVNNLGQYLMRTNDERVPASQDGTEDWKDREWTGQGLELIWRDELNHAETFDTLEDRNTLLRVLERYARTVI